MFETVDLIKDRYRLDHWWVSEKIFNVQSGSSPEFALGEETTAFLGYVLPYGQMSL